MRSASLRSASGRGETRVVGVSAKRRFPLQSPTMGQVALGIRSLLIKAAIFFVMCALLVWALGGELFPKPEIVDTERVRFAGQDYFWRMYAGGDEPNAMHWEMWTDVDGKVRALYDDRWVETAALFVQDNSLYYAGRRAGPATATGPWILSRRDAEFEQSWNFPTRLALETALDQLRNGASLQDVVDNVSQQPSALDRTNGTADETSAPETDSDGG